MSGPTPLSAGAGGEPEGDQAFRRFLTEVARRQLADWLPGGPGVVLDISCDCPALLGVLVAADHVVVHAEPHAAAAQLRRGGAGAAAGRVLPVRADTQMLGWLADESVDLVVAEGGTLTHALAVEVTLEDVHRVLRPGGRLLASVDSLVAGLSRLADLGRWAELADVPAADVVLIPAADGGATRCFWPEELHSVLSAAGFEVEWMRPRTVLAEETVTRALLQDPTRLASLVQTELALGVRRQGESIGAQIVTSARRPA